MNKKDCKKEFCINRLILTTYKDNTVKKPYLIPNNIEGIIKCNNPNCKEYFDYVDYNEVK